MKGRRGSGGGGHGMQGLIKQANQMQAKMKKLEEELKQKDYSATSGGGAVQAVISDDKVKNLTISPDVFKEGDAEMLQDMIVTAVNDALASAKKEHDEQMQGLSKGINFPGIG